MSVVARIAFGTQDRYRRQISYRRYWRDDFCRAPFSRLREKGWGRG